MSSLKKITLATATLLASTAFVNAADIFIPETEVEVVPETRVIHKSGGWYLRGDLGYAKVSTTHVDKIIATDVSNPGYGNFSSAELDASWSARVGLGYQINDMFRVDATLGHVFETDFTGDSSTVAGVAYDCSALSVDNATSDAGACNVSDTATFGATTIMANAYIDIATIGGFTPYVGAGLGGSHVHWSNLYNDVSCDTAAGGDCLNGAGANYNTTHDGTHGAKNGWRFAYGLHAGASYDLTANMKIDAGYSFTHISGGDMYGFDGGGGGVMGHHGDIKVHEVRAGLRYNFD